MGIEEFLLDRAEKQGIEKGMTKKELEKDFEFTCSLLTLTEFNTAKIAELVGVSEAFVLKVKTDIAK